MRHLNQYQHFSFIARHGQGEVWKAYDVINKRPVAIKFLLDKSPQGRALFIKDVRERLDDKQTVKVYESNLYSENPFFVMEYCPSGNLGTRILKCKTEEIIVVLRAMIIALKPLHVKGGFHGDIKPDNIMLADIPEGKTPKLNDFGLAHVPNPGSNMTQTHRGTDPYKALEVRLKLGYWSESDIYSLGITIFELLTGRPAIPFRFLMPVPPALTELLFEMTNNSPNLRPNLDVIGRRLDEIERELKAEGLPGLMASLSYPSRIVGAVSVGLVLWGLFGNHD